MSVAGSLRSYPGVPRLLAIFTPIFGVAIWSLLLWRVWKRPRQWGLGVGIFLLLMIAFQAYLWRLALANPKLNTSGVNLSTFRFTLIELPIFIAGVSCILLRFRYPNGSAPVTS